jgi:uncharacterized membrane protein
VFSERLQLPSWLVYSGRLHPLVLHFPLALMLVTIAIYLSRKPLRIHQAEIFHTLFFLSALTAVVTALMGLFLSTEGGYDKDLLSKHQWLGVAVSVLTLLVWMMVRSEGSSQLRTVLMLVTVPVLIIGSHFGGVLTHGEDFLKGSAELVEKQVVITDSSVVYAALIEPILSSKCYSCHNDKKSKGELIMTSVEALMKGGKNGEVWIPGDPLNSHILQRLDLPEDDKKHMPPRGKTQVTEKEKELLYGWIKQGADTKKRFMDYPATDSFRIFLASHIPKQVTTKTYSFKAADPKVINEIRSPYCSITPLAIGSPALQVRFLIRSGFKPEKLKELEKLYEQVVDINASNMPVKDEDLQSLKKFNALETLNLNGSDITGSGLVHLPRNGSLHSLSISNTKIDAKGIEYLTASIPSLKNVYCWSTIVDSAMVVKLQAKNPSVKWIIGYKPDPNELLQLTPPQLADAEKFILAPTDTIVFKHPMPGIQIRYTLDGSKPDSLTSALYTKPFTINKATRIRAIATRPGWLTSDTTDNSLFAKSIMPYRYRILNRPDSKYMAKKDTTLFDNVKGEINQTSQNWLGYNAVDMGVFCGFKEPTKVNEVVVSTLRRTGPHIMPPEKIEVWAGNDSTKLKMIGSIVPEQPSKYVFDLIEVQRVPVNGTYQYFKIKVNSVKKLPKWHNEKGKKAWVFVDEIFFN